MDIIPGVMYTVHFMQLLRKLQFLEETFLEKKKDSNQLWTTCLWRGGLLIFVEQIIRLADNKHLEYKFKELSFVNCHGCVIAHSNIHYFINTSKVGLTVVCLYFHSFRDRFSCSSGSLCSYYNLEFMTLSQVLRNTRKLPKFKERELYPSTIGMEDQMDTSGEEAVNVTLLVKIDFIFIK